MFRPWIRSSTGNEVEKNDPNDKCSTSFENFWKFTATVILIVFHSCYSSSGQRLINFLSSKCAVFFFCYFSTAQTYSIRKKSQMTTDQENEDFIKMAVRSHVWLQRAERNFRMTSSLNAQIEVHRLQKFSLENKKDAIEGEKLRRTPSFVILAPEKEAMLEAADLLSLKAMAAHANLQDTIKRATKVIANLPADKKRKDNRMRLWTYELEKAREENAYAFYQMQDIKDLLRQMVQNTVIENHRDISLANDTNDAAGSCNSVQ
ncbi:unnamed protein product [Caenorhabditis auriculariae]|uniref:Uncharacterized protein n=1 Tax=Caenorhabditis auriculariae TaxID=2777116 RepID=A0A8S1HD67_9PELO|nr:unnamed protein product [Caenorhabditis auriculariae]